MTVPDAIARIMSAYEEGSVVHSHGRFEDGERRHVLRCPDGRYVVLNCFGQIIADSAKTDETPADRSVVPVRRV